MIEISAQMLQLKEAIRHNWNTYFASCTDPTSVATQESFSELERALMRALVLEPLGAGVFADQYRTRILSEILVVPACVPSEIPIRFGKCEENGNYVWEEEVVTAVDSATKFFFFDFFDWDPYGQVDLPFVRVLAPDPKTGERGQLALIEHRFCKFYFRDNSVHV